MSDENENEVTPERIMQTGMAFWASKALLSAVELGVFTELARHPEGLDELRGRLGLHERGASDFLDALVSMGFLERDEEGVYSNAADADLFLDRNKPSYIGGILEMSNHRLYPSWAHLTEALKTGHPQSEAARNPDFFAELYADPARLREFLQAMTGVSRGANMAMAQKLPWAEYGSFVDAGTAQGDLAVQIVAAHPHLTGVGFDLPQVGPIFEENAEAQGVGDRLSFVGGSFFEEELPKADVVLMGHILHDWDLAEKKELVRKAYAALPAGGLLVVYDTLIDDARRERTFGLLMSLNMLVETHGGFDYTEGDGMAWMMETGFKEARVEHLVGPDYIVVGTK